MFSEPYFTRYRLLEGELAGRRNQGLLASASDRAVDQGILVLLVPVAGDCHLRRSRKSCGKENRGDMTLMQLAIEGALRLCEVPPRCRWNNRNGQDQATSRSVSFDSRLRNLRAASDTMTTCLPALSGDRQTPVAPRDGFRFAMMERPNSANHL